MKVEELALSDITPYEKNPRKNDEAVKYVAESIKQFGFKVPIVIDKNNVIVCGHTRYKAAKKLKLKKVPCVMADDLTDEQIKAYRLADNKTGEFAEWDLDILNLELEDLNFTDIDMSDFGFDLDFEKDDTLGEVVEDDFEEELPEEPKSKLGDIYQLGNHRLMCGDSTSIDNINKLMNGEKADMVFTDPPYGNGNSGKYGRGKLGVRTILNDENLDCFNKFISILPTDKIIYFLQWRTLAESLETIKNKQLKINTVGVWDKKNAGLNGAGGISEQWEAIIFAGNLKYKKFGGNVFSIARENHKRENSPHPHQKPIKLLAEIFNFIEGSAVILDPFGGSGSTLIACEQLNIICYMMELDPKYVDVIISRWEQFTGEKAIKINE